MKLLTKVKKTLKKSYRNAQKFSAQTLGLYLDERHRQLAKLKSRLEGQEKIFVVGNGPSLRLEDLEALKKNGAVCFGANNIFKIFNQTAWRPDYLCAVDILMEKKMSSLSARYPDIEFIVPKSFSGLSGSNVYHFQLKDDQNASPWPKFGGKLFSPVYQGFTVTYISIQLAVQMGAKEVYLIGVDHNYDLSEGQKEFETRNGFKFYRKQNEQNYFIPDYHENNDLFCEHRVLENELAYISAKRFADAEGVKILNATRGGKLNVFERVKFEDLFAENLSDRL